MKIARPSARLSKVVTGEVDRLLMHPAGELVAVDPGPGDGAAATQPQIESGEIVVTDHSVVDAGRQVQSGDGLFGELHEAGSMDVRVSPGDTPGATLCHLLRQ